MRERNEAQKTLTYDEKRMELTAHLGELRTRLMRSILYLILGALITYQFFKPLYNVFYVPLEQELTRQNKERIRTVNPQGIQSKPAEGEIPTKAEYDLLQKDLAYLYDHPPIRPGGMVFLNVWDAFMVRFKISIIAGVVLASPLVLWELALFILPALTLKERRPFKWLLPLSISLLCLGVYVGYRTMYYAIHWFLSYLDDFPQPVQLMQDPNSYILFFIKLLAVFGIVFQLPVVLTGGAFLGLITSKGLMRQWRWGVILSTIGALFVPTNDFITMALISGSILVLYYGSFFLVRLVEIMKARAEKEKPDET
jgi:sec-independent protein translocase protein TatC